MANRSFMTKADCERIGTTSVADISNDEIEWMHHNGCDDMRDIAEVAASQEPPNVAMLGLIKAVCFQGQANALEYSYGARLKATLKNLQELSEAIDAHIQQAEQGSGQQR